MKLALLVTDEMKPVPKNISVTTLHKDLDIIVTGEEYPIIGDHLIIEGTKEAIVNWLKNYDGVWVSGSIPQEQKFTVMHIREDLCEKKDM